MKLLRKFNVNETINFSFFLFLTVGMLLCILQSCKKDKDQIQTEINEDAISIAHKSFADRSKSNQVNFNGNSFLTDSLLKVRKPLWTKAYTQSSGDTIVVFVPIELPNVTLTLKSGGVAGTPLNSLLYLRLTNTGKGFDGGKAEMITLIPDKEWKKGEHFSGNLLVENWFIPNIVYYSLTEKSSKAVKNGNSGSSNTVVMGFPVCQTINWDACVGVGSESVCTPNSTTTCQGGGGDITQGGGGGAGIPTGPIAGGGSGGNLPTSPPEPPLNEIVKDSLTHKFPCATKLILNELEKISAYTDLVRPFLQMGMKPSISWNANVQSWSNGNYSAGTTISSSTSGKGASSDINLNISMLQNASQLLIAATAIHETYHAYINYMFAFNVSPTLYDKSQPNYMAGLYQYILYTQKGGGNNYVDHYNMLTSQFDNFTNILYNFGKGNYPIDDCRKALLFGMNNPGPSPDFGQKDFINQAYNDLLTKYGFTVQSVDAFTLSQVNATANKLPASGCP